MTVRIRCVGVTQCSVRVRGPVPLREREWGVIAVRAERHAAAGDSE
jgi:hypothetical protein